MKVQLHFVSRSDGQTHVLDGWDRWDIELKFRRLAPEIATAEVRNEQGVVVAVKELNESQLHGLPAAIGWGPLCPACWSQAGQDRHAAPHGALTKLGSIRYRGGMADGSIVNYGCDTCTAELQLDNDRKDPGAGWSVNRWPTWVPSSWGVPGVR